MDIPQFVNEVIPHILRETQNLYRVKGGGAHNIYFLSEPSLDWDIECSKTSAIEIMDRIQIQAKKYNLSFDYNYLQKYNSYHIKIGNNPDPVVDLLVTRHNNPVIIDGIFYISLQDHVNDSLITTTNRAEDLLNEERNMNVNIDILNRNLDKLKIDIRFEIGTNLLSTLEDVRIVFTDMMVDLSMNFVEDVADTYRENLRTFESHSTFDGIFKNILNQEQYEEWLENHYPLLVIFDRIVISTRQTHQYYQIFLKKSEKFMKSSARLEQIREITWDFINPIYQSEIIGYCGNGLLFLYHLEGKAYWLNCRDYNYQIMSY